MKETIIRFFRFMSPFILIALIVFLVDPYNLFNFSHIFSEKDKIKCINRTNATTPRGNILWKIIKYKRNPAPNIILGDSRMDEVSNESLERYLPGEYANLSVQGGNYRTITDMFWMASSSTKLQNVIIQVNFTSYAPSRNWDLYGPAHNIVNKPIQYFISPLIIQDAFSVLYYSLTRNEKYVNRSYKQNNSFWNLTEESIKSEYSNFDRDYPVQLKRDLTRISNFCKQEKINLLFVIAPDYFEVHNFIKNNKLENEYDRFINDITTMATTIDLNNGIPFSYNKENYADYYHIKSHLADTLAYMIFQSELIKRIPNN